MSAFNVEWSEYLRNPSNGEIKIIEYDPEKTHELPWIVSDSHYSNRSGAWSRALAWQLGWREAKTGNACDSIVCLENEVTQVDIRDWPFSKDPDVKFVMPRRKKELDDEYERDKRDRVAEFDAMMTRQGLPTWAERGLS